MISSKVSGYVMVPATEAANIEALASGAISVCFEVTKKTGFYQSGKTD